MPCGLLGPGSAEQRCMLYRVRDTDRLTKSSS